LRQELALNTTALITGASSGIGYEFARVFAENHHNVVLVARNEQTLSLLAEELGSKHGIVATVLPKDLAKFSAAREITAELQTKSIHIDILVNNAGLGSHGLFAEMDLGMIEQMMQVNMVALTQLTKLLLPAMLKNRSGKICNVASTASFQPGPLMAVYYATKAYVLWLSKR